MRILIATPLYPPQVGGPATYSRNLEEALRAQGHTVDVKTFGPLLRFPPLVRHAFFAIQLLPSAFRADALIAFDTFSVGVPATLVSMVSRKPLLVRVGGDFLWERYVQRTGELVPLPRLYREPERWGGKEKVVFAAVRFVARHAHLAFSSGWQLEIWRSAYALDNTRVAVIENAIEKKLEAIAPVRKNFLFYTREITLKNHAAFRSAFARAKETYPDIELEEGMVAHAELLERMRACYAVVLPSISDITPNYIIDAIRCGKPFLLTKYSGYVERFGHYGVLVDPLDGADMARGVERLTDATTYEQLRAKIANFSEIHTYDDIAREFLALIEPQS